mmetsp:Transcript_25124/g.68262  ORF Transcript_25124/g.68262 Transcript_25124/m.68262 type:complete len:95 (+) Transcript_25124:2474-2758(+)
MDEMACCVQSVQATRAAVTAAALASHQEQQSLQQSLHATKKQLCHPKPEVPCMVVCGALIEALQASHLGCTKTFTYLIHQLNVISIPRITCCGK